MSDKDTIYRQDAIGALESGKDKTAKGDIGGFYNAIIQNNMDKLRNLPSAQPEIVRCKDCKHAHLTYDGECKHCDKWTDEFGIPEELYLDGNFYCGYAERRTDE